MKFLSVVATLPRRGRLVLLEILCYATNSAHDIFAENPLKGEETFLRLLREEFGADLEVTYKDSLGNVCDPEIHDGLIIFITETAKKTLQ